MRLKPNDVVTSPVSGTSYRIGKTLGEGGFGLAYQAWELNRRKKPVEEVCLKTTPDQASWHRESYFGELLSRSKRVIQTLDSFPLVPKKRGGRLLFALVLELADKGTVADYLEALTEEGFRITLEDGVVEPAGTGRARIGIRRR